MSEPIFRYVCLRVEQSQAEQLLAGLRRRQYIEILDDPVKIRDHADRCPACLTRLRTIRPTRFSQAMAEALVAMAEVTIRTPEFVVCQNSAALARLSRFDQERSVLVAPKVLDLLWQWELIRSNPGQQLCSLRSPALTFLDGGPLFPGTLYLVDGQKVRSEGSTFLTEHGASVAAAAAAAVRQLTPQTRHFLCAGQASLGIG